MDRNGIATAVTSISAPGLWFGDSEMTNKLTRQCNDYAAQMRIDHPGRFGMFASLPLPNIDASLREIEYSLDTLRADGIGLMTNCEGKYPGDVAFAPIFDELNRRKAVVYFHPTSAPCSNCLSEIPAATLDFPFDTTRAVTSLLFGGTFARCPDIRFIFSHAGGTVPFLADRYRAFGGEARVQGQGAQTASSPNCRSFITTRHCRPMHAALPRCWPWSRRRRFCSVATIPSHRNRP